ncbi:MAG TPA: hypothetical protein VH877_31835 [Polyangia bacterium]|jgi:hypothetical protein|nr:hypothetical protein [Polyangia bacterium]
MNRLRIDAHLDDQGTARATWLLEEAGRVSILDETVGRPQGLPVQALTGAFGRYARPLDEHYALPPLGEDDAVVRFSLPSGEAGGTALVRSFSFLGWGEVEPTEYLLYEVSGREPVCAPARLMSAALLALARAAERLREKP